MKKTLLKYLLIWFISAISVSDSVAKDEQAQTELATFGGGCFWGMERKFESLDGVIYVISGYSGGKGKSPVYKDYRKKGHTEVVRIKYDPSKISYKELLEVFWKYIGKRCHLKSQGTAYKTVIFYHNENQKKQAEASKKQLEKSTPGNKEIYTDIVKVCPFYKAEEYHQDYHSKKKR